MITTTLNIPGDRRLVELLRALRGAPLSCLHALRLAYPTPVDREQLCFMTDWEKDKVTAAMRLLCDLYGFATRVSRYAGWILTTLGTQIALPGLPEIAANARALGEGDLIAFPNGSSSSLYISSSNELVQTTTTTEREGDLIAFPTDANALIEKYLRGCKRATSQHAVRAALARGDSLADIETEMILWVSYAESPLGKGIRSAAIHAVSKIKDGEKCPDFLFRVNEKDREHGDAWRAWLTANELWLARLRELQMPASAPSENIAPDAPDEPAHEPAFAETLSAAAKTPASTDARAVEIWERAREELRLQMTKATFDTWVKPAFAISYDAARAELVIGVRNLYAKQWLENRLYGMLERTVQHVIGSVTQIKFTQVSAT